MQLKSIVLTTGIFPPDIGGPASFIPILADRLTKKDIKVTVITLTDKMQDDTDLPYKIVRISRKIKKPFRDILVVYEIIKAAKNSQLIFSNTLAFESAIASILTRKKLVQKIVGYIAWERANTSDRFQGNLEEYQNTVLDIKSRLTNFYRNFGVQNSDLIITPSNYLKQIVGMWNYPKEKIEVIYNTVEFEEAKQNIPKEKFRIVSVARLIPHKGIEGILNALSRLEFDFEYIVIGDGPLREKLEMLSYRLKVDAKFIGNISKKEVASWLKSSDLFILNSSYEGLPHIVLEAMENSCSVLVSNVGGTPEVVKDMENGLLFEHNNIKEMFAKISLLKNNENLKKKLISNGRNFTNKFANVDKMVGKYIDVIEQYD